MQSPNANYIVVLLIKDLSFICDAHAIIGSDYLCLLCLGFMRCVKFLNAQLSNLCNLTDFKDQGTWTHG